MKKLSKSEFRQISIMLFGLFFGAGNLMFPPLLGYQAGNKMWIALLGFSITAVLFPVLAAIVVAKTEGLSKLSNRVGATFSLLFTTAIYISIGPGLGIPRAGSVPFEMAIAPYIPSGFNLFSIRLLYTFIFFALAAFICLNPSKLVVRVGKYLTPILLALIFIMFMRIVFLPPNISLAKASYQTLPLMQGFLSGYDTMDAVAGLNFGFVVALALRRKGILNQTKINNYTIKSGFWAGLVLFVVYAMLASIGMLTSGNYANVDNGVVILTNAVKLVFGDFGLILLALIFTLACLTTCIGLISSGSEYFYELFKHKLTYKTWVYIWTIFSFVMANFGLNKLLEFSIPLLILIYPIALLLIVLGISHDFFNYHQLVYRITTFLAFVLPLIYVLRQILKIEIPLLSDLEASLWLAEKGLSWLLPTLIALVFSTIITKISKLN